MNSKRLSTTRAWATGLCALFAMGVASTASTAEAYKADALLSVEMGRSAVAEKIAASWERDIPAAQKAAFKAKLFALRADQLLAASLSGTFDGVLEILSASAANAAAFSPNIGSANTYYATQAERQLSPVTAVNTRFADAAKAVGDIDKDLVFTPLTPCRLHDSRTGQASALGVLGGVMANQTTRTLAAGGTCGIPATGVRSIFLSFHAYNFKPETLGVITVQKTGDPVSGLASTWTGGGWATGTAITATLDNGSFDVFVGNGQPMTADMVVDVMGYFTPANRGGDGLRVIGGAGSGTLVSVVNGDSSNTTGSAVGATISGGSSNTATISAATISGGFENRVTGTGLASTIGGGQFNAINGGNSTIGGGFLNTISGNASVIAGGGGGVVASNNAFMGSGGAGTASNCYNHSTGVSDEICRNVITATAGSAVIGGGHNNKTSSAWTFIGGGASNLIAQNDSAIVGGWANTINAQGFNAFIGAGNRNTTGGNASAIVGGSLNAIADTAGNGAFIGGGRGNLVTGDRSAIVGGGSEGLACWNPATGLFDLTCANRAEGRRNFIGAGTANRTAGNESTIAGGVSNIASGALSFVGGGVANSASGDRSVVVGGGSTSLTTCFNRATGLNDGPCQNVASGVRSTVVGGVGNTASGQDAFVGAGSGNEASGVRSVALGGVANTASGYESVVPGGRSNHATGAFSFAAGRNARTNVSGPSSVSHFGAFVWADTPDDGSAAGSQGTAFRSTDNNQFAVRARGGIYFKTDNTSIAASATDATAGCALLPGGSASWSCSSDRNLKDGIKAISPKDVLSKVVNLPLSTWQFKGTNRRHLSPMAQDFWAAFGFGEDDRHITASDVSGVALAAVQGVNQKMNDELASLKAKNAQLQRSNESMMRELAAIKKKLGF